MSFTIGSLFDGSGGFPLAAFMCGGTPVLASEVEPYPIAVTKTRFPYMKHLGSVTEIKGNEVEPVDVITFGSPCQDLSVAGKRAGLKHTDNGDEETTRSGLFMEAVRIIKEMREATGGKYPRFALWENVPGAFSSNKGEDFRVVCEELIKIVEPTAVMPAVPKNGWNYADQFCGDGWSLAYRVLDAQYWGVPQRRRRIYLVLDLGGQCAGEISFKCKGLRGYFEEGRTPWQGVAGDVENGVGADDRESKMGERGGGGADRGVTAYGFDQGATRDVGKLFLEEHSKTLTNGSCPGHQSPTLRAEMHGNVPCVMEAAGFKELNSAKARSDGYGDEVSPCLAANNHDACVCYSIENHPADSRVNLDESGKVQTLTGRMGTGGGNVPMVLEPTVCLEGNGSRPSHRGDGYRESDVMYTLNATEQHSVAYSLETFHCVAEEETTAPLKARDYKDPICVAIDRAYFNAGQNAQYTPQTYEGGTVPTLVARGPSAVAYGFDQGATRDVGKLWLEEQSKTLTNGTCPGHHNGVCVAMSEDQSAKIQYIVRRLTPTECARLQGFPDRWATPDKKTEFTDEEYAFWLNVRNTHAEINSKAVKDYTKAQMLTWYNKLHTDSAEYKLWGNGIALPCALYVMQGIAEVFANERN